MENVILLMMKYRSIREQQKKTLWIFVTSFFPSPSNLFVTSYLRSGTNWISYIIQLIFSKGATPDKDLDQFAVCIDEMTLKEFKVSPS